AGGRAAGRRAAGGRAAGGRAAGRRAAGGRAAGGRAAGGRAAGGGAAGGRGGGRRGGGGGRGGGRCGRGGAAGVRGVGSRGRGGAAGRGGVGSRGRGGGAGRRRFAGRRGFVGLRRGGLRRGRAGTHDERERGSGELASPREEARELDERSEQQRPDAIGAVVGVLEADVAHGSFGRWAPTPRPAVPTGEPSAVVARRHRTRPAVMELVLRGRDEPPLPRAEAQPDVGVSQVRAEEIEEEAER